MLTAERYTFLIVDPSAPDRELLRHFLEGYRRAKIVCNLCSTLAEAEKVALKEKADVILLDYELAVADDFAIVPLLRETLPDSYIIILTSKEKEINAEILRMGAQDYLPKAQITSISMGHLVDRATKHIRCERDSALAQTSLKLSEQNYKKLIDNIPDIVVVHKEGQILFVNRSASTMLGYDPDEVVGKSVLMFVPGDEDRATVVTNLKTRAAGLDVPDYEIDIYDKQGQIHTVIVRASATTFNNEPAFQTVLIDITERKKMEEELLKARKLESIGLLAGGIAHDFNNILTGIIAGIATAKLQSSSTPELVEILDEVESASFKASELTRQLLTFSKGGEPIRVAASISDLVDEAIRFSARGSRVVFEAQIPDDITQVHVDRSQIGQVLSNLIINACQAMPNGGNIAIRARNVVSGNAPVPEGIAIAQKPDGIPLMEGVYVEVSVADTGMGISHVNLQRIFDPYFTTKQKGNGLGLATVYSILQRHDGTISVTSEIGTGTTFTFYLPTVPNKRLLREPPSDTKESVGPVLVMDDDDTIRYTLERFLKSIGYTVVTARNGDEALKAYNEGVASGKPFLTAILDLTISGGLGGKDTAKLILDKNPSEKIIAMSGYSNDPVLSSFKDYGFSAVLRKPFRPEELNLLLKKICG